MLDQRNTVFRKNWDEWLDFRLNVSTVVNCRCVRTNCCVCVWNNNVLLLLLTAACTVVVLRVEFNIEHGIEEN
jgi:hypothetical protein